MSVFTKTSFDLYKDKAFVIHPINPRSISPLGYDLRIGLCVLIDGNNAYEAKGDSIEIPAKGSAFIITLEHVWLSSNTIATIHARGSLAAKGLLLNSTTVDPNWSGQMTMLVHNLGIKPLHLSKSERFCTMMLHQALHETKANPGKNPLRVAQLYGETYGVNFVNALTGYITLETDELRLFNKKVSAAREMTYINNYLGVKIKVIFNKLKNFRMFTIGVLILLIFLILSLQFIWIPIQNLTGIEQSYDTTVFSGQILAVVTLMTILINLLFKTNKDV